MLDGLTWEKHDIDINYLRRKIFKDQFLSSHRQSLDRPSIKGLSLYFYKLIIRKKVASHSVEYFTFVWYILILFQKEYIFNMFYIFRCDKDLGRHTVGRYYDEWAYVSQFLFLFFFFCIFIFICKESKFYSP